MNPKDALLRRHAKAEGEAVVPGATMDPHPIRAARPEAVVGDPVAEEAEERPREADAHEPDLTTVGVTGEDEISLSRREMLEGARIMQEDDAERAWLARVLRADAFEMRLAIAKREVHPDDLDRTHLGLDRRRLVDEE